MKIKRATHGLGWFSIGLGTAQLLLPGRLGRTIGVGKHPVTMRALGAREILTGLGILAQRRPRLGMWARVAGDAMDLSLLALALRRGRRTRIAGAAAMVAGIGLLDYVFARKVQRAVQ